MNSHSPIVRHRLRLFTVAAVIVLLAAADTFAAGALFVRRIGSSQQHQLLSIDSYDATVEIRDQVATTHIDQRFYNSFNQTVEATFVFPLPEGAMISHMAYWFNGQKYTATVKERQEAQNTYNSKIRRYMDPALLQYLGDNVFKLNIAPIFGASEVRFEITYSELLPYENGSVDYNFLLKTTELSPEPLERISLSINAQTSRTFKSLTVPSHEGGSDLSIDQASDSEINIIYGDENIIPDRDLHLRFQTERNGIDMNVQHYAPLAADNFGTDRFFAAWITPPDDLADLAQMPRDVIFTADISSSMDDQRLEALKQSMHVFLDLLTPIDRFNIIVFSTDVRAFAESTVAPDAGTLEAARLFVDRLGARGFTNYEAALELALAQPVRPEADPMIMFFTDGAPTWGETDATALMALFTEEHAGKRVFPIGLGDEVNTALLNSIAAATGGFARFIDSESDISDVVTNLFSRASAPVLRNLNLDLGDLPAYDIYTEELPDLIWGSQVIQFGRYTRGGDYNLTLSGDLSNQPFSMTQTVNFGDEAGSGNIAVARLWAREKINALLADIEEFGEHEELVDAIVELSIRFNILTKYTALYADPDDDNPTSTVEEEAARVGLHFHPAVPNPIASSTNIEFEFAPDFGTRRVKISVYDASGALVAVLHDGMLPPGKHSIRWDGLAGDGRQLSSGVYYCKLELGGYVLGQTLVIQR